MTSNNGAFSLVEQTYSFEIFLKINIQRGPKIVSIQFDSFFPKWHIHVTNTQINKQNITGALVSPHHTPF